MEEIEDIHIKKYYEFQSEGTYFYFDPEYPQLNGKITILENVGESEEKISNPVRGIDPILSSLGLK